MLQAREQLSIIRVLLYYKYWPAICQSPAERSQGQSDGYTGGGGGGGGETRLSNLRGIEMLRTGWLRPVGFISRPLDGIMIVKHYKVVSVISWLSLSVAITSNHNV